MFLPKFVMYLLRSLSIVCPFHLGLANKAESGLSLILMMISSSVLARFAASFASMSTRSFHWSPECALTFRSWIVKCWSTAISLIHLNREWLLDLSHCLQDVFLPMILLMPSMAACESE